MRYWRSIFICLCVFVLVGCDKQLLVHSTSPEQITPILKDYAGIHGYRISYANDQTRSYRLELGSVYIPATSQTEVTKVTLPTDNIQPLTSYEQKTWKTVSALDRTVAVAVMVRVFPKDSNVIVKLTSDAEIGALSDQVSSLHDYLQDYGFTVEYL